MLKIKRLFFFSKEIIYTFFTQKCNPHMLTIIFIMTSSLLSFKKNTLGHRVSYDTLTLHASSRNIKKHHINFGHSE